MKSIVRLSTLTVFIIFVSCSTIREISALAKCEFKVSNIKDLTLVGVNIQKINSITDLSWSDAGKIAAAIFTNSFPLAFTVNLDVKNPNKTKAALNHLEWILLIDDIQMATGNVNDRVEIAPNGGVSTLPININLDLKQALKGKSYDAIKNFAFNLAGYGDGPTRITIKAKPTIMIGTKAVQYPGYISIKTQYTS
jgi:hypothetical protein